MHGGRSIPKSKTSPNKCNRWRRRALKVARCRPQSRMPRPAGLRLPDSCVGWEREGRLSRCNSSDRRRAEQPDSQPKRWCCRVRTSSISPLRRPQIPGSPPRAGVGTFLGQIQSSNGPLLATWLGVSGAGSSTLTARDFKLSRQTPAIQVQSAQDEGGCR